MYLLIPSINEVYFIAPMKFNDKLSANEFYANSGNFCKRKPKCFTFGKSHFIDVCFKLNTFGKNRWSLEIVRDIIMSKYFLHIECTINTSDSVTISGTEDLWKVHSDTARNQTKHETDVIDQFLDFCTVIYLNYYTE